MSLAQVSVSLMYDIWRVKDESPSSQRPDPDWEIQEEPAGNLKTRFTATTIVRRSCTQFPTRGIPAFADEGKKLPTKSTLMIFRLLRGRAQQTHQSHPTALHVLTKPRTYWRNTRENDEKRRYYEGELAAEPPSLGFLPNLSFSLGLGGGAIAPPPFAFPTGEALAEGAAGAAAVVSELFSRLISEPPPFVLASEAAAPYDLKPPRFMEGEAENGEEPVGDCSVFCGFGKSEDWGF